MEFRVLSDLHIDRNSSLPIFSWLSPEDKNRVLIIAGDLCSLTETYLIKEILLYLAKHFKYVLIALGNHEYIYGDLYQTPNRMQALVSQTKLKNVILLHKKYFIIQNILIMGTTLWSDLSKHKQLYTEKNHHKHLPLFENCHENLNPKQRYDLMHQLFCEEKQWIFNVLKTYRSKVSDIVVVTHHAPSFKSIHPLFKKDKHQYLYASNLDNEIKSFMPSIWLHGHTHYHFDYYIGKTRILANPFGFPGEETKFEPNFLFSL